MWNGCAPLYKAKSYIQEIKKSFSKLPNHNSFCGVKHIIFLFVNHFELAGKKPRLDRWMEQFPQLVANHRDSDGRIPRHTWFYAMDLFRDEEIEKMRRLIENGYGEMELHWHHSHDTEESFINKLGEGLRKFQKYGFMKARNGNTAGSFGFIHGNWSLGNSLGNEYCGVDNEISLLIDAGCYGDFTFPALFSLAQCKQNNSIHFVKDCQGPRGYDGGEIARLGRNPNSRELMIFQGPLALNWHDWRFGWHPRIENGEIGFGVHHDDERRIDCWVDQQIGVMGRADWIFVKVFCHGGQDYDSVLSQTTGRMFDCLETKYNDGKKYLLHYVTAREAFNIVRAAEDGKDGNPYQYRDYLIPASM